MVAVRDLCALGVLAVALQGGLAARVAAEQPPGDGAVTRAAVAVGSDASHPLYVLQNGDDVTIRVFGRPELDETVKVRPDGRISVPLVNDLPVAGLDTRQLEEALTVRYSEYFREPEVTVIVRTFAGLKVYVGGQVARPGMLPLESEITAMAAVLQAGGFLGTAKTSDVVLLRNDGSGHPLARKLDMRRVLEGEPDEVLQPFDVIYVPMSGIAKVNRFVDQYIRKVLPITLTAGFTYLAGDTATVVPVQ